VAHRMTQVPRSVIVAVVCSTIAIACSRPSDDVAPATAPADAPPQPATQPVATACVLTIAGQRHAFPPARLRLARSDATGGYVATLHTDELPDDDDPNHFLFEMPLDNLDDPARLAEAEYRFQLPPGTWRDESPQGIFTTGREPRQLLPQDVVVRFDDAGTPGLVTVVIDGTFQVVGADEASKAARATVSASIEAVRE